VKNSHAPYGPIMAKLSCHGPKQPCLD